MKIAKKIKIAVVSIVLLLACLVSIAYYIVMYPNIKNETLLYIPTGSNYNDVLDSLHSKNILKNTKTFEIIADYKKYSQKVKSGRYKISKSLDNRHLLNMLISGSQFPVNLSVNSCRTVENFAGKVSKVLEMDSITLINCILDSVFLEENSLTKETVPCIFIPNSYEMYWNISPEKFLQRMLDEYDKFWNESRRAKAENLNLTLQEVSILASIVGTETNKNDEKPTIASVYLNRLKKGMLLQADPTVIFANGDFTIKRVLYRHLNFDSPYNTYKYQGLPPGPIYLPSIQSIDAVLNAETTDYLYFCAKDDFSGYHSFAKNFIDHQINANKYKIALSLKGY
jgi:UPF0755 protein